MLNFKIVKQNTKPTPFPRKPLPTLLGGFDNPGFVPATDIGGINGNGGKANDNSEGVETMGKAAVTLGNAKPDRETLAEIADVRLKVTQDLDAGSKIGVGLRYQLATVNGQNILRGTMSNADMEAEDSSEKPLSIGRIHAKYLDGHIKISAMDAYSPSTLSRGKLRDHILGRKRKAIKLPGMLETLHADLDTKTGTFNSSYTELGPRCYVVNIGEEGLIASGKGMANVSQCENLKLPPKSVLVVLTKKVLEALGLEISPKVEVGSELFEAQISASIGTAVQKCTDQDGVLNLEKFYREIAKSYTKELKMGSEQEAIAASLLVYQQR